MIGGWVRGRLTKTLAVIAGLTASGFACAVSMGGIHVTTALGEPLKAEVAIETASKAEANNLSARLAAPEMFNSVGIQYPYGLPRLKLEIETRAGSDQPYLKITSTQPVNEPFVTLLVELNWPSGKLLRQYTFLLDPPGYAVEQPNASEVRPVEPSVVDETMTEPQSEETAGEAVAVSDAVMPDIAPTDEKAVVEEIPEPAPKAAESKNVVSGIIRVKRGDTLYQLARQIKPSDVSLEQMLVALYRVNAGKFDGKNMNRIRAGKILRVPEQSDLDGLDQAQAVKEIRMQTADWHAYRQKLAAASNIAVEQAAEQETSGKISTTVADKVPAAAQPGKDIVKLSKGEAPDDKTAESGSAKSGQDRANALEEEITAKNKALMESNERIAMLEKNIKAMQRLVELKSQPAAPPAAAPENKMETPKLGALPKVPASSVAAAPVASATPPASAVQPASGVLAASAVRPAKPVAASPTPSLLDDLLGEPLYLAAGAAALLALGGLGIALRRRIRRGPKFAGNDAGSNSGRITAPPVPSPETGDFTSTTVTAASSASKAPADDSVDPISEADLFLNFGRDEQAEEILKDALTKNPANYKIHLKLLSIYLNRRDVSAFSKIAQQLKDSGNAPAWEQAAAMGLKLEPNNPMYGGASVMAAVAEQATPKAEVMFDVGTPKESKPMMDFDLGFTIPPDEKNDAGKDQDQTIVMNTPIDLDVTGSNPSTPMQSSGGSASPAMDLADLIFDVTGDRDSASTAAKEAATKPAAPALEPEPEPEPEPEQPSDQGLAFTLEMPETVKHEPAPAPEQTAAKAEMNFDLSTISLNLDQPVASAAYTPENTQNAHQEVATKLDLANAYQEMGDIAGARDILQEVLQEGDDQQRAAAEALLQQLG